MASLSASYPFHSGWFMWHITIAPARFSYILFLITSSRSSGDGVARQHIKPMILSPYLGNLPAGFVRCSRSRAIEDRLAVSDLLDFLAFNSISSNSLTYVFVPRIPYIDWAIDRTKAMPEPHGFQFQTRCHALGHFIRSGCASIHKPPINNVA